MPAGDRIVERVTHIPLLHGDGFYRELYELQIRNRVGVDVDTVA